MDCITPTPPAGRRSLAPGPSILSCAAVVAILAGPATLEAQGSSFDYAPSEANQRIDPALLTGLDFRSLEFSRGGRVTAVTGVVGQPLVYYFGSTGGGVWKTTDAGVTWKNVSDEHLGVGSIGAVAVAPSDPNVIYVGTGTACPRGNVSSGDGIYRSTDAGKTFQRIGLEQAGQIGRIRVHPTDPDLVYVAALGHIFGPNEERGVFRSKDGGATWEKVLFLSERTGFVDLAMDATNPRILYAGAWRAERKPWTLISGGEEGGGVWKTTDGGDTWTKLEGGLPDGVVGKTGVAVSPARPERVWVLIEAAGERGGLYRSDDGGKTFERLSGDNRLRQRAWYYTHIYADPQDENTVYVLNTGLYRSVDGGKTFGEQLEVPHGDNHDLWIDPDDPKNMINGNDGGANVSFDGGATWSSQMGQPTAEIYRVFVDEQWPYRVYGPQQDNSTISVSSTGSVDWNEIPPDWYEVGGCESGHIAIDPRDPDIVYAGCYGGNISRMDRKRGELRNILAYPQLQLGAAPRDLRYRFQWNAPIRLSPHDPDTLYHTAQVVLRSRDDGQSWEVISPDLTTNNPEQQDYTGGPITRDSTGIEVYNTIFAFEESKQRAGELWAGSDDGKIHVSGDDGGTWQDVTPKQMPLGGTVNVIELSPHDPDRVFVAVYRYRQDDYHPYIFRTNDGGKSWALLTDGKNGIPPTHFTRAIREDPDRKGLLYAGTEFGLYVSFDDGRHWQRLQNNLPVTPVTDLLVYRQDLVVATQGRAFWVLDDVEPLHALFDAVQAGTKLATDAPHLYAPRTALRGSPKPARLRFWVPDVPATKTTLTLLDGEDNALRTFTYEPKKKGEESKATEESTAEEAGSETEAKAEAEAESESEPEEERGPGAERNKIEIEKAGFVTVDWNLRQTPVKKPKGVVHWGRDPGLPLLPDTYRMRLTSGETSLSEPIEVALWPELSATETDLREQYDLAAQISARLEDLYQALRTVRDLRTRIDAATARLDDAGIEAKDVKETAKALKEKLTALEKRLTQPKSKSPQDPLNFPPQLDNQFVTLLAYVSDGDNRPTAGARERFADLEPELDGILAELGGLVDQDVAAFNEVVRRHNPPAVAVPDKD